MKMKIVIAMDNAAFSDCNGSEVARILRELASKMDHTECGIGGKLPVKDINGNKVGEARITR